MRAAKIHFLVLCLLAHGCTDKSDGGTTTTGHTSDSATDGSDASSDAEDGGGSSTNASSEAGDSEGSSTNAATGTTMNDDSGGSASTTGPNPDDPYGPCPDGQDSSCLQGQFGAVCTKTAEYSLCMPIDPRCLYPCPDPLSGSASATCDYDSIDAANSSCSIGCSPVETCPNGMTCLGELCVWSN